MNVAITDVHKATIILVFAASHTTGSARIVSYQTVEKVPSGTVGKR